MASSPLIDGTKSVRCNRCCRSITEEISSGPQNARRNGEGVRALAHVGAEAQDPQQTGLGDCLGSCLTLVAWASQRGVGTVLRSYDGWTWHGVEKGKTVCNGSTHFLAFALAVLGLVLKQAGQWTCLCVFFFF